MTSSPSPGEALLRFKMHILQITIHTSTAAQRPIARSRTDSSLHAVLDDAFARVPDYSAVLVTGDLVQDDPSGYLRFRSIFGNLKKPVLCIPGNHDEPRRCRESSAARRFNFAAHTRRMIGNSSCSTATIPGTSAPPDSE